MATYGELLYIVYNTRPRVVAARAVSFPYVLLFEISSLPSRVLA